MAKLYVLLPAALYLTLLLHAASVRAESFFEGGLGELAESFFEGGLVATFRKLSLGRSGAGAASASDPSNPNPPSGGGDAIGLGVPGLSHCGHGTKIEYDYVNDNKKGPTSWGTLKPEWAICGTGKMQSPIDLTVNGRVDLVSRLETVTRHHKPCTYAMLVNRGTSIELQWVNGGYIYTNRKKYNLMNAHWHSPSEHTLNGKRYDLELQMVHADNEQPKNFAVISILYKIGNSPDPFITKLEENLSKFTNNTSEKEIEMGVMDPNEIGISGRHCYRYQGSLTVPPCSETVVWTVEEQIKIVSAEQVNLIRGVVHDSAKRNARPLQQLNGRNVRLYIDPQITANYLKK